MKNVSENIIRSEDTIHVALKKLESITNRNRLTLFVLNHLDQLMGTLTDGDIRRGLLDGITLEQTVDQVMRKEFKSLKKFSFKLRDIKDLVQKNIKLVPILDEKGKIFKIIDLNEVHSLVPADAVIMAGGRGERLLPLTKDIPKPMLKIGTKPIIEHNIDRLIKFGIDQVYISVKHLSEKITDYFQDGSEKSIQIQYIKEEQPLGTIGAVSLIENLEHENVIVMNSDLLTNIDYEDFYEKFEEEDADLCVATIPYKIKVPYAILEIENQQVQSLKEKPTYTFYASAGIYLLKKEVISLIPKNEHFNATDLIEMLIDKKKKVTYFPILSYWLDIGNPEDYNKAMEDIEHLQM